MRSVLFLAALSLPVLAQPLFKAKVLITENKAELIWKGVTEANPKRMSGRFEEVRYPATIVEHEPVSKDEILEVIGRSENEVLGHLRARHVSLPDRLSDADDNQRDEVIAIIENGPSHNRIDLVFMGDGYTLSERSKFVEDAKRLARDMFEGETFKSYLPLFNVYAVFRPSLQSGIGKNDTPKDTAYGLYRQGNTLRAIFCSKPSVARSSCAQAPGCDYPILMANDPYYGGLGGEFAITTSSPTSGTVVLRHELGHNFGKVGEEYDGGGYFGANQSSSLSTLKWTHWLSGPAKVEPAVVRFLDWPWYALSKGPYEIPFKSDGQWETSMIRFSASGIATDDTLNITLNGQTVPFQSPGHPDRVFHTLTTANGFPAGSHLLKFQEQIADGDNWVSSVDVYEYGRGYHFEEDYVGVYPLFDEGATVQAYRSNHETCLMRNMLSPRFCAVCQENNWLQMFKSVTVIDKVNVEKNAGSVTVNLKTQDLDLDINWYQDGKLVPSLHQKTSWQLPVSQAAGKWEVKARFTTPEVRKDTQNLLTDTERFEVTG